MSLILKGIDMPATPKAIVIYPNGTIIGGDKKGTKILKAEAIQIPKTIICENLLRDIEYEVHKDEFDY